MFTTDHPSGYTYNEKKLTYLYIIIIDILKSINLIFW